MENSDNKENKDINQNNSEEKEENYEKFGYEDEDEINISQTYTNRMLQKKRLERKMRKGNIWIARIHVLLRLIILSGLIYGFYHVIRLPQWYVSRDIFTTSSQNLQIINNTIVPTYKILNELRKIPVINEPIYKFETDKIRNNLLQLEPIENVYIRRYWYPARIQIIVKERIPLISVHTSGDTPAVAVFTQDGVLLGSDYLPLPAGKQTIKVITTGNYRQWDEEIINKINNIVFYIEETTKEKVECINMSNTKDIYIKIQSVLLRVGEFDESIYERLSRITSIKPQLKKIKKTIQYIDLRWRNAAFIKTEQ